MPQTVAEPAPAALFAIVRRVEAAPVEAPEDVQVAIVLGGAGFLFWSKRRKATR